MATRGRTTAVLLMLFALATLCRAQSGENYLVTIETATQATADDMSSLVSGDASGLIGVIEGTQSRVQTLSGYAPASIERTPTLTAMTSVVFDSLSNTWSFQYRSLPADSTVNDYKRVLYFSKTGTAVARGDVDNICLQPQQTDDVCRSALGDDYVTDASLATAAIPLDTDHITTSIDCTTEFACITATVTSDSASGVDTIDITMSMLAIQEMVGAELTQDGVRVGWKFNIGMMFVYGGGASNMNIVEHFEIIESTYNKYAISKVNQYTIARHVQFFMAEAPTITDLRLVKLEFLIEAGHEATDTNFLRIAFDGETFPLTSLECSTLQAAIDSAQSTCINPIVAPGTRACTPEIVDNVVRVVLPISSTQASKVSIGIEVTIETIETGVSGATPLLSLLQLTAPAAGAFIQICQTPEVQQFDSVSYAHVDVYNKAADNTLALLNTGTTEATRTFSSIQSLLTIVLRPQASTDAATFFASNPSKRILLDDLYMAHSLDSTVFTDQITVMPTAQRLASQRSALQFQAVGYLQYCPLIATAAELTTTSNADTCITTHDYGRNDAGDHAALERAVTGGNYVYELQYIGVFDIGSDAVVDGQQIDVHAGLEFALVYTSATQTVALSGCGTPTVEEEVLTNIDAAKKRHRLALADGASCTAVVDTTVDGTTTSKTITITATTLLTAAADTAW
ncbi:MAG: hypothetical protein CMF24_08630, partial [Ilumatobacter sp.]|nr:hypothetical protein [Ilumatobacter sp.]